MKCGWKHSEKQGCVDSSSAGHWLGALGVDRKARPRACPRGRAAVCLGRSPESPSPSLQVGLHVPSREPESMCRSNQGTICNSYVWLLIVFFDMLRVSDAWLGLGVHWGKELWGGQLEHSSRQHRGDPATLVSCCCLVAQSCPTLCHPMVCSTPGSSVHGISQARTLEWIAISSSRGSSQLRDQMHISCIGGRVLYHWATTETHYESPPKFIPLWKYWLHAAQFPP